MSGQKRISCSGISRARSGRQRAVAAGVERNRMAIARRPSANDRDQDEANSLASARTLLIPGVCQRKVREVDSLSQPVMAGLGPAIHDPNQQHRHERKTWIPGTSLGMTV